MPACQGGKTDRIDIGFDRTGGGFLGRLEQRAAFNLETEIGEG